MTLPTALPAFAWVALALATFRVSHMAALEDGPGDVFRWIRLHLGATVLTTPQGERWHGNGFFGKLIVCPLCLSVWFAPLFIVTWVLLPVSQWVIVGLAVSGASCGIEMAVRK